MEFILGVISGILLSITAIISGKKINRAVDKIEKDTWTAEHPKKRAIIVKMEDKIAKLLSND